MESNYRFFLKNSRVDHSENGAILLNYSKKVCKTCHVLDTGDKVHALSRRPVFLED